MKNGLLVADTGPLFSLAIIDQLSVLDEMFDEVKIPNAVWDELTVDNTSKAYPLIIKSFNHRITAITKTNELSFIMDFGESQAVTLYRELNADFLLIDDKKARKIAENFGIKCIGVIGLLAKAKRKGLIKELKPLFESLLKNKRYYSITLLNQILAEFNESSIRQ